MKWTTFAPSLGAVVRSGRLRFLSRLWQQRSIPRVSSMRVARPVELNEQVKGLGGKWVAVKSGQVVAAAETMDKLLLLLQESQRPGVRNATIFRVAPDDEPELVGLG